MIRCSCGASWPETVKVSGDCENNHGITVDQDTRYHKDDPLDEVLETLVWAVDPEILSVKRYEGDITQAKAEILKLYILKSEVEDLLQPEEYPKWPATDSARYYIQVRNELKQQIKDELGI